MFFNLKKKGFTPTPESPIFQGGDACPYWLRQRRCRREWKSFWAFGAACLPDRQGFQPNKQEKLRPLGRRGFTFIELLVYIAILSIVMTAIFSFFLWSNKANTKSKASREVLDSMNYAIEIMSSEIKEASSIYAPTTVFDSNPGQLSLVTKKYLPTGETTSYIDLYICGTQLCMKKESQLPVAITSDRVEVSGLIFREIATSSTAISIQISLLIQYKNPDNKPEYQASAENTITVSLRNY